MNGDMSRRVNEALARFSPEVEVYSIDETFLDLGGCDGRDLWAYAQEMRALVRRWTGIPTCVGIGPTKTLAKLANVVAKKNPVFGRVCDLTFPNVRAAVLRAFPAGDVWGIGHRTAAKLARLGITTAAHLRDAEPKRLRALGTVVLERIVMELRGLPCLELEVAPAHRKGLAVTRSFGRPVTALGEAVEAIATHAARAGEKLRSQNLVAGTLCAFLHTNRHAEGPRYHGQRVTRLTPMTSDTRDLVTATRRCLEAAWRNGFVYAKVGVILDDLCPAEAAPLTLFDRPQGKSAALMATIDELNAKHGRGTIFPAAAGIERGWSTRAARVSPRYTTNIKDLAVVLA